MNKLTPELENRVREDVRNALAEDVGSGDLTAALIPADQPINAAVTVREEAVLCGQPWFNEVFHQLDPAIRVEWAVTEGELMHANTVVCVLQGLARPVLTGERSALNFLQTLSATATAARAHRIAISNTRTLILDTRKTIPGLRLAQKYAVRTGGAANHRTGLYDGILIKENHIAACGGIRQAVESALASDSQVLVEVEVETVSEAREAMRAKAHRLLLDDFTLDQVREVVRIRDEKHPDTTLEVSGGVSIATLGDIAETGVDFVSIGAITKHVRAIDFSMRFEATD